MSTYGTSNCSPDGIRRSFSLGKPGGPRNRTSGYPIDYSDRLFVRLTRMGRVVMEFMVTHVNDYSELLAEIHRNTRHLPGLVMMSVRNMLRGWLMERPMMLGTGGKPRRQTCIPLPEPSF